MDFLFLRGGRCRGLAPVLLLVITRPKTTSVADQAVGAVLVGILLVVVVVDPVADRTEMVPLIATTVQAAVTIGVLSVHPQVEEASRCKVRWGDCC